MKYFNYMCFYFKNKMSDAYDNIKNFHKYYTEKMKYPDQPIILFILSSKFRKKTTGNSH